MGDLYALPAAIGAAPPAPAKPRRKRQRGPTLEQQRARLMGDLAAYISDLAQAIQRLSYPSVADTDASVLHALAVRQDALCTGMLSLCEEGAGPEVLDEVRELLAAGARPAP